MEYINKVKDKCKAYIREHHGWSFPEAAQSEAFKEYQKEMQFIKDNFNGKRVKIQYTFSADFIGGAGEKIGRIKVENDKIKFYEGKKTTRFNTVDCGWFNGWFAVIIPLKIELIQ